MEGYSLKRAFRSILVFAAAAAVALVAGCSAGKPFVYEAGPPKTGGIRFPVKIAVLMFEDGTEDFTKRGSVLKPESLTYNAVKSGWMPPELWAKTLADDMAASGAFKSVRFIYHPSELRDDDFRIEGKVGKAYVSGDPFARPSEYAVALRALRKSDGKPFWEKEISRAWMIPKNLYDGCGMSAGCRVDRSHEDTNRMMREMCKEAREDLENKLAALSEGGTGNEAGTKQAEQPSAESVDRTIDKILKGR